MDRKTKGYGTKHKIIHNSPSLNSPSKSLCAEFKIALALLVLGDSGTPFTVCSLDNAVTVAAADPET